MKVAVCFAPKYADCVETARRMAQAQRLSEQQGVRAFALNHGAIACVTTSDQASAVPLLRQATNGNVLMVAGVPILLDGSLDAALQRALEGDYRQAAKVLPSLDGTYAVFFWDARNRKLVVVTDFLGLQPLYTAERDGRLLMASDLKAFPASRLVGVEMDPAGWGAFLSFGFTVGAPTQLAGVKRAEPACVMVYDPARGTTERSTYWQWPEERRGIALDDVDTGELVHAMRQEVRAYLQHTGVGTVLLSGGFDSRFLLALLHDEGLETEALVLAHKDELWGADGRLASAAARRLGVHCRVEQPDRSFYDTRQYLDYLVMNEVMTASLYLFIAQVSAYLRPEMQAVWEGVSPGICLHPYALPPGGFKAFLVREGHSRESPAWRAAFQVFGRAKADAMFGALSGLLKQETAKYPDDEFGILQFKARNYMRNRLALNPLKVYTNTVLPFTPGFSKRFWSLAAAIPHTLKTGAKTYFRIFARHFPKAASVPFLSGDMLFTDAVRGPRAWTASALHRLAKNRAVGRARRLYHRAVSGTWMYWTESQFLERVRAEIDLAHPDLNADGLRGLKRDDPLPFYWQIWRWVMEGRLTAWNTAVLLDENDRPQAGEAPPDA